MYTYGGLRIKETVIGVTHIPDRKRPCLYIGSDCVIRPLAYFTSEEAAKLFWNTFQQFMGVADHTEPTTEDCSTVEQTEPSTDCGWK